MLKKMLDPKKEDICPNCGEACFATDILCSKCGKNLDDLFEQLPDATESNNIQQVIAKIPASITWPASLLIIFSPFFVSLATALLFTQNVNLTSGRDSPTLIQYVVLYSSFDYLGAIIALTLGIVPLSILTIPAVRMKLGKLLTAILTVLFAIYTIINIWLGPQIANMMSVTSCFAYFGGLAQIYKPASWVHFVSAGCTILLAFILMVVLQKEKIA